MNKQELMELYYRMRRARGFETRVAEQYTMGRIGGAATSTPARRRWPWGRRCRDRGLTARGRRRML